MLQAAAFLCQSNEAAWTGDPLVYPSFLFPYHHEWLHTVVNDTGRGGCTALPFAGPARVANPWHVGPQAPWQQNVTVLAKMGSLRVSMASCIMLDHARGPQPTVEPAQRPHMPAHACTRGMSLRMQDGNMLCDVPHTVVAGRPPRT